MPKTRRRFADQMRSESGIAVPVVLITFLIVFGLATATVVASIAAQRGTTRDQDSKSALAAAEAGVERALLHYNRIAPAAPLPCFASTAGLPVTRVATTGSGWCPQMTGNITGQPGSEYRYSVRPCGEPQSGVACPPIALATAPSSIEIVSTGTVNGVSRRVSVTARSSSGLKPFVGSASIVGLDSLTSPTTRDVWANIATNGNVALGTGTELTCNYAGVGPGRQIVPANQASCPATQDTTSLPPINQGDVAVNNSNCAVLRTGSDDANVHRGLPVLGPRDAAAHPALEPDPDPRRQRLQPLQADDGQPVEPLRAGGVQGPRSTSTRPRTARVSRSRRRLFAAQMSANSRMAVTGSQPGHLALLFVGSPTLATRMTLSSNTTTGQACEQDFVVYAPRTAINLAANSAFCGALAGKSVTVNSNSSVSASNIATDFELPDSVAAHYGVEKFVECTGPATAAPNADAEEGN